jgi:hypothetical protein
VQLEVELSDREVDALALLTAGGQWSVFEAYLKRILEANRNTLEKQDEPLVRGDCKRLRRLLELPQKLLAARRARPLTAQDGKAGG